jgi:hypothetical protein
MMNYHHKINNIIFIILLINACTREGIPSFEKRVINYFRRIELITRFSTQYTLGKFFRKNFTNPLSTAYALRSNSDSAFG